jgi:uncharacterized protein with FMN-binding domain
VRRTAVFVTATALAMLAIMITKAGVKANADSTTTATIVRSSNGTTVVTGPQVVLAHGIVQVRATLDNGRIVDVDALSIPHDNPHSWDGGTAAAVKLRTEVLTKQSANVNIVSGATYTSHAYMSSLQAALDAAGVK